MMSTKRKSEKLPKQAENAKRGAAGSAKTTAGRSRVFRDKSKYKRSEEKKVNNSESVNFETRKNELLNNLPKEFRESVYNFAYQECHGCCENDILIYLEEMVDFISGPLNSLINRSYNQGYRDGSNGEEL
jgi:hypothetical protein